MSEEGNATSWLDGFQGRGKYVREKPRKLELILMYEVKMCQKN